jgi:D-aminopeptidase
MNRRPRLRELGITIGAFPPGAFNAITDVPGVQVGHTTLIYDAPRVARTGVTVVLPRPLDDLYRQRCYAGYFSFNGNGEMTGVHWLAESGMLGGAIAITNTHQVGVVRDALVAHAVQHDPATPWCLPMVAETYDGWLNDIDAFHVQPEHLFAALASAAGGSVAEGNVGGGTGMICHGFKGGIGTSSRRVETAGDCYTVGALVQTNYGDMEQLRVDGRPVGRRLAATWVKDGRIAQPPASAGSSIIIIVATDAPLLADQCQRLARRATVGLARVGGTGNNGSGDIFLAFATGNALPVQIAGPFAVQTLPAPLLTPLFDATADAVEEAILNALCAATTMTGYKGRTVHALPLEAFGNG